MSSNPTSNMQGTFIKKVRTFEKAQKAASTSGRQRRTWLEAEVKPEYCPNVIHLYLRNASHTNRDRVRSHLKSMGWSIHHLIDKGGLSRYRYRPPRPTPGLKPRYVSLCLLCLDLSKAVTLPYLESTTQPRRLQTSLNDEPLDLLQDGQTTDGEGFESETSNMSSDQSSESETSMSSDQSSESETSIYKKARISKFAKKANRNTTSRSQTWIEAEVKPEYCPHAVRLYVDKGSDTTTTATKVRSHLKHIGWSIDHQIDEGGLRRYRYRPPQSTSTFKSLYDSLSQVCLELLKGDAMVTHLNSTTEPKGFQSSPKDESLDLLQDGEDTNYDPTPAVVSRPSKDLVCPLAVIEWSKMETKESQKKDEETEDRKRKAKECLVAMGWNISSRYKKKSNKADRLEVFYFSPRGRQYATLKQACLGCIKEGHLKGNSTRKDTALELANVNSTDQSKAVPENQNQFQKSRGKRKLDHLDGVFHGRDCSHSPSNALNSDIVSHQAVIEWSKIEKKESLQKDDETQDRKVKAKECLQAMGWDISYRKKGDGQQLFYFSPSGKQYGTLKQACIGCITEGHLKNNSMRTDSDAKVVPENRNPFQRSQGKRKCDHTYRDSHGRDSLQSQSSNRLRSTKRVQEVISQSFVQKSPRTILSWLIDNKVVLLGEKVFYHKKHDSRPLATGKITSEGIRCSCCDIVYTLTQFEVHAGSTYRKPSAHIFLEDGRSLLDCQCEVQANTKRYERDDELQSKYADENESVCFICDYGGEIILCDQCPCSFHKSCLGLEEVPEGDWFCPLCCCGFCGQNELKEGSNKCINCEQCERKFHVDCLHNRVAPRLEINPEEESRYCSEKCEKISRALKEISGKPFVVGKPADNLTWTIIKSLVSGSCDIETLIENNSKLNVALGVMHECFKCVKTSSTSDLTKDVIFSKRSELKRMNFKGFYTILLQKNDELISVASVRFYGEKVAELPLIGTRSKYRKKGMCRILINELEKKLIDIGVERLVLPAVPTALNMWTSSFGFQVMTASEKLQFLDYAFLDFQDTVRCQKFLGTSSFVESIPLTEDRPNKLRNGLVIKFRRKKKSYTTDEEEPLNELAN